MPHMALVLNYTSTIVICLTVVYDFQCCQILHVGIQKSFQTLQILIIISNVCCDFFQFIEKHLSSVATEDNVQIYFVCDMCASWHCNLSLSSAEYVHGNKQEISCTREHDTVSIDLYNTYMSTFFFSFHARKSVAWSIYEFLRYFGHFLRRRPIDQSHLGVATTFFHRILTQDYKGSVDRGRPVLWKLKTVMSASVYI